MKYPHLNQTIRSNFVIKCSIFTYVNIINYLNYTYVTYSSYKASDLSVTYVNNTYYILLIDLIY